MDEKTSHNATPTSKGMDKGKGKDVAPSSSAPNHNNGSSTQPHKQHDDGNAPADGSFAARIATSASSLSRAVLTSRPESLHSATSGKVPSGPSSAPDPAQRGQTATYHGQKGLAAGAGAAFAQGRHSSAAGELQYGHFMGAQADPDSLSQVQMPEAAQPESGLTDGNVPVDGRSSGVQPAVNKQESRDGQAVIDLLNNLGGLDDLDDIDDGLRSFLSPEEESALGKALFDEKKSGRDWAVLLDFQPDFLQGENLVELQQHFGDVAPQQARALWMDGWSDVLTSYTDEVWGDLGSLAREAQREVDEARGHAQEEQGQGRATGADPSGMKALRRLRQILAHVRETY